MLQTQFLPDFNANGLILQRTYYFIHVGPNTQHAAYELVNPTCQSRKSLSPERSDRCWKSQNGSHYTDISNISTDSDKNTALLNAIYSYLSTTALHFTEKSSVSMQFANLTTAKIKTSSYSKFVYLMSQYWSNCSLVSWHCVDQWVNTPRMSVTLPTWRVQEWFDFDR